MNKPAVLGGEPVFASRLNIVSPKLPPPDAVWPRVADILRSGNLTNNSQYVRMLEAALTERLVVPHAILVSNATLGLILALDALKLQGEVILPSFTYVATVQALYWAKVAPVFVDILPDTFTMDPRAVEAAITSRTCAILAVHIYGHPCDIDELAQVAARHGLALVFDAAHALGSHYKSQPIGQFGDAEVFSFHATKVFPTGEGGCVTTTRAELARYLDRARKFGGDSDDDTVQPGLNAKMQEFNAILGLAALPALDEHIAERRRYAAYLMRRLGRLPGLSFQAVKPYVSTNYQNFAALVDEREFGLSRDALCAALEAENIFTRKYFYPPLHRRTAYREPRVALPVTERVSEQVLCLPFYSEMTEIMLEGVCAAVERIQAHSPSIRREREGSRDEAEAFAR